MAEGRILERLDVVGEALELRVGNGVELAAERQVDALRKRPDEADDECGEDRSDKQPRPPAHRAPRHGAVAALQLLALLGL